MPAQDVVTNKYWIAGYRINNRCEGILDPMMAHAVWIDDNSGKGGIVLVSVDCVGLLRKDVEAMKAGLSDFAGREIYLIHFAARPESMDRKNLLISADFPCYLAQDRRAKQGEPSHAKG